MADGGAGWFDQEDSVHSFLKIGSHGKAHNAEPPLK